VVLAGLLAFAHEAVGWGVLQSWGEWTSARACVTEPSPTEGDSPTVESHLCGGGVCDLDAPLERAQSAFASGSPEEAEALLRRALAESPEDAEAYASLLALRADRPLPSESPSYFATRNLLPVRFVKYETKRFVILSDAESQWTMAQGDRLERAHHQFQRFARRLDLRPLPLQHKLICVLFARRDDYQAFARTNDHVEDPWISGYYSPAADRIVFYHVESNPSVAQARETLDQMEQSVRQLNRQRHEAEHDGNGVEADSLRTVITLRQDHIQRQRERVDEFAAEVSAATTVHEAIHQLLFHTGVQSRAVEYPLWLSEGLATAFETTTPNQAFGPDHEYPPRRARFHSLLREGRLLPLQDLLALTDLAHDDDAAIEAVYHQGYALVVWLCRYRPAQFRDFLFAMRRLGTRPAGGAAAWSATFEDCFGGIEKLERDWLRDEQRAASSAEAAAGLPAGSAQP
jgi:hypothetical protein